MKGTNAISIGGLKIIIGDTACQEIPQELINRNCKRPMIISDEGIRQCGLLDCVLRIFDESQINYVLFTEVPSDPPSSVVQKGALILKKEYCDSVIAIGGGSVIDAAKAINLMSRNEGDILEYDNSPSGGRKFQNDGWPLFTIPTTSGTGSEVTQYAVITSEREQRKATIGDERLTSKVVFLNPQMTLNLPSKITAATGIDALAHAIEAYTSNRVITAAGSSVFSDTLALEAIRYISSSLAEAYACGGNIEARKMLMLGSTLAGLITQAGSGAGHGLGSPLGAHYHVPHGVSVGIMLPHVMEYSLTACPKRYQNIASAMGRIIENKSSIESAKEAVLAVKELLEVTEFPKLQDYVEHETDIDMLSKDAMKDKCCQLNARPINLFAATQLYQNAWNEGKSMR